MTRLILPLSGLFCAVAVLSLSLSGCGSDSETMPLYVPPTEEGAAASTTSEAPGAEESTVSPQAMLRSVVQLLRSAAVNPGGDHFNIAKDYLNQYFVGVKPAEFALSEPMRAYLSRTLPIALDAVLTKLNVPEATRTALSQRVDYNAGRIIPALEAPTFSFRDSRHIEDCLLLSTVARRVAGDGEDLARVQRVFDWLVRQVQLVPPGGLAVPGTNLPQAPARPYDVLLRAMATEQDDWAERSWVFLSFCRQLGFDAGLVRLTPPGKADSQPRVWAVAVLIDGVPYLFDCRIGQPIPGPDGQGVATLEQAATLPNLLAQLDLPGQPYPVHQADLAAAGKLTIWIDSTLGLLTPRMRQLQRDLAGHDRMVLFRDAAEQDAAFARAFGDRFGGTELWPLPIEVETRLFTDPAFNESAKFSLQFFDPRYPLLFARMGQLRGDLMAAVQSYAAFRFAENPLESNGKTPIPPQVQQILDFYATYYLGLAKLDQKEPDRAADFFRQTLQQLDEWEQAMRQQPDGQQVKPYFSQYRWGAQTNLARIKEALGDRAGAIHDYAAPQPTGQAHGNLLRARALIWSNPFATSLP